MLHTTVSPLVSRSPRGSTGIAVALFSLIFSACSNLKVGLPAVDVPDVVTAAFSGPDALKDRPLTSSGENAWLQASLLDGWAPRSVASLILEPRTGEGGFRLSPGVYEGVLQAYCVGIGTTASPGGLGYVGSALQGDRADVIQAILRATSDHLDVDQHRVQVLIWAVVAGTRLDQMSDRVQATALELLGRSGVRALGLSMMDGISQRAWERAVAQLPPDARRVFAAEARIRNLVADAGSTYEDIERIAVRRGDPMPSDRDMPIPVGRWTRHPAGYLVRFFPNGYSRVRVQVAVPGGYTIEQDAMGRVVAIDLGGGYRSEVSYNDSVDPRAHGGIAGVSAYLFTEVRFMRPDPERPGGVETAVIEPGGYAFQMVRTMVGGGRTGAEATTASGTLAVMSASDVLYPMEDAGSGPWVSEGFSPTTREARAGRRSPPTQEAFQQWNRRREQAEAAQARYDEYRRHADWATDPPPDDAIDQLGNWEHYQDGLEAAISGDPSERWSWLVDQNERQYDALRLAAEMLRNLPGESEDPYDPSADGGGVVYDPTGGAAIPGSVGSQRLAVSGRGG